MIAPIRPESPGSKTIQGNGNNPADFDPDLAAMGMIKDMLKGLDAPSDISKSLAVRKSIYTALNHVPPTYDADGNIIDPGNPTGYDASLRIRLYSTYEKSSLNISAKLFNSFMAFLMKPKMIIQGLPTGAKPDDEPGLLSRAWGRITGKGQPAQSQGAQQ